MFIAGNYKFTVRISNGFDPDLGIDFVVDRYHHRSYISSKKLSENGKSSRAQLVVVEPIPETLQDWQRYTIKGGSSLAFPMFFADEYLILSAQYDSEKPWKNYKISVGMKTKCFPTKELGPPDRVKKCQEKFKEQLTEKLKDCIDAVVERPPNQPDFLDEFYPGGTWTINEKNSNWKLLLAKYGPDPEDDDVIIGPDPPD